LTGARGTGRLRVVQSPPDDDADLRRFPRRTLRAATVLHRVARRAPWWSCSDGLCRFDLRAPHGTCYLAHDDVGALLEVIGAELAGGVVSEEFLAARRIHRLALDADVVLADTASRRAAGFGVTNELSSMADYAIPQAWAATLHDHHFAVSPTGCGSTRDGGGRGRPAGATFLRFLASRRHRIASTCGVIAADRLARSSSVEL
jgi:hypothetical protein